VTIDIASFRHSQTSVVITIPACCPGLQHGGRLGDVSRHDHFTPFQTSNGSFHTLGRERSNFPNALLKVAYRCDSCSACVAGEWHNEQICFAALALFLAEAEHVGLRHLWILHGHVTSGTEPVAGDSWESCNSAPTPQTFPRNSPPDRKFPFTSSLPPGPQQQAFAASRRAVPYPGLTGRLCCSCAPAAETATSTSTTKSADGR